MHGMQFETMINKHFVFYITYFPDATNPETNLLYNIKDVIFLA